jgi:hypothetical protein
MKNISIFRLWLIAVLLSAGLSARAETAPTAEAPTELTVVIIEPLTGDSFDERSYDRLARVFTESFEAKKWPFKIETERLSANERAHALELRVFFKGITYDTPDALTFRGWMIFQNHGTKHDFGIVRFNYSPRVGQSMHDNLDAVVRGAADTAAKKIDAILHQTEAKH